MTARDEALRLADALHSMSKSLESSGCIDGDAAPEAYPAILDAMNLLRQWPDAGEPLTALQIAEIARRNDIHHLDHPARMAFALQFAKSIEAHHGITRGEQHG